LSVCCEKKKKEDVMGEIENDEIELGMIMV
jgi:hypothetical protein